MEIKRDKTPAVHPLLVLSITCLFSNFLLPIIYLKQNIPSNYFREKKTIFDYGLIWNETQLTYKNEVGSYIKIVVIGRIALTTAIGSLFNVRMEAT